MLFICVTYVFTIAIIVIIVYTFVYINVWFGRTRVGTSCAVGPPGQLSSTGVCCDAALGSGVCVCRDGGTVDAR